MIKFLIQKIDRKVKNDFSLALIESVEYHKWFYKANNPFRIKYFSTTENQEKIFTTINDKYKNHIPIGSVEFVSQYLKVYHNKDVKPRNVPSELFDEFFTGRKIFNGTEKDIIGEKFVKSNDKIKGFTNITDRAPKGNYQISDLIDFESEYRVFVYKRKIVGLQNYSGDFLKFPNVNKIEYMIKSFINAPIAYTLDVGICKDKTCVVEIHDFFSCGFYGFADYKIVPYMFCDWFNQYINT